MGKRGRARTRAAPAGRRRECVQGKKWLPKENGVSFYRLLQKGSSQKKNELQPLRMSKHVLRRLGRRERAKSFLRFWEFAFTKPKFWGFLRRVVPGFCVCPPAHVIARGGHRRGGGVGKERGEGQRGARGETPIEKTSQNTSFRTALL